MIASIFARTAGDAKPAAIAQLHYIDAYNIYKYNMYIYKMEASVNDGTIRTGRSGNGG
jgi:hypothetical protein